MALSSLIAMIARLFGSRAESAVTAQPSAVTAQPPAVTADIAQTPPVSPSSTSSAAPAPAAAAPLPAGAPVAASAPGWLDLCRPLTQFSEMCYLKAYPDPGSALAKALQARGIWQKVLDGMPIPSDDGLRTLSGAPWTCGWGQTGPDVKQGTAWTQTQADSRLAIALCSSADIVDRAVKVQLTPAQKAALVDLLYNVGPGRAARAGDAGRDGIVTLASGKPSTLLSRLNAGDYAGAAAQFAAWNKSGGVMMPGLVARRARERDLFLTGTWSKS